MSGHEEKKEERIARWKYRKKQKLQRRRNKRKEIAENRPVVETTVEDPLYEESKALWENREETHKLIEMTRLKALEKEKRAKELAEKKWKDTLLNIPLTGSTFSLKKKEDKTSPLKTFVQPQAMTTPRKTYRERFYEQKISRANK